MNCCVMLNLRMCSFGDDLVSCWLLLASLPALCRAPDWAHFWDILPQTDVQNYISLWLHQVVPLHDPKFAMRYIYGLPFAIDYQNICLRLNEEWRNIIEVMFILPNTSFIQIWLGSRKPILNCVWIVGKTWEARRKSFGLYICCALAKWVLAHLPIISLLCG